MALDDEDDASLDVLTVDDDEVFAIQGGFSEVERLASSLSRVGAFLEAVAIVATGLVVVGAVIGMISVANDPTSGTDSSRAVAVGLAVLLSALVVGAFYWAVARALRLLASFAGAMSKATTGRVQMEYQGESAREKECPDCYEDVWEQARVCRFCGYRWAPPAPPPAAASKSSRRPRSVER